MEEKVTDSQDLKDNRAIACLLVMAALVVNRADYPDKDIARTAVNLVDGLIEVLAEDK